MVCILFHFVLYSVHLIVLYTECKKIHCINSIKLLWMPYSSWLYFLIPDHSIHLFPVNFNPVALLNICVLYSDESL